MPLIKITVQEEKRKTRSLPAGGETYTDETYFETVHEMTSVDQVVVAGALRAIANKYDPASKVTFRGND